MIWKIYIHVDNQRGKQIKHPDQEILTQAELMSWPGIQASDRSIPGQEKNRSGDSETLAEWQQKQGESV